MMSMQKRRLISVLEDKPIEAALILPFKTAPNIAVNLELVSGNDHVVIRGQGEDVDEGNEAFYLIGEENSLGQWWTECWDSDWKPRDLVQDGMGTPLEKLWRGPRRLRFFYDPEDRQMGLRPKGAFEGASAIAIAERGGRATDVILLYASTDAPFSVEIITTPQRRAEVLRRLVEFHLG